MKKKHYFYEQFSASDSRYSIQELIPSKRWLFIFTTPNGLTKYHFIKSFYLGENKIYKNGGLIMASSLDRLIFYLSEGLVDLRMERAAIA